MRRFPHWRAGVMAVVLAGHGIVLDVMLRAVETPDRPPPRALLIRLDLPMTRPAQAIPPAARSATRRSQAARSPRQPVPRVTPAVVADPALRLPPLPVVPANDGASRAAPGYIAGGGALAGSSFRAQAVRVPGDGKPAAAPRFRMVNAQRQGVAGVVRFIHDLAGGIDPHCLDFDVWRGLTPAELAAQHVTTEAMDAAADTHGCRPLSPPAPPRTDGAFGAQPIPRGGA